MKVTYVGNTERNGEKRKVTYTGTLGPSATPDKRGPKATYVGVDTSKGSSDGVAWHTDKASIQANKEYFSSKKQNNYNISALGAGNYGADKQANKGYNYGKGLLKAGGMGLSAIARDVTTPLAFGERTVAKGWNALFGNIAPMNERGFFNAWDENIALEQEGLQQRYAENTAKGGQYAEKGENLLASAVETLPSLALAFATGGTSAAAKAGTLAAQTAAKSSPALVQTLKNVAAARAKDPNFLSSAAQIFSHSYNDAKAEGVDDKRAALYAIGNAMLGSEIEISGGIQNLPGKVANQAAWRTLVNTMLQEGKEEVLQGIIDRTLQNAVYNADNPYFGVNENAIFDPGTAAEEFAGGAIVGGLLSGGTMGVNALANRVAYGTAKAKYNRDVQQNTAPEMNAKAAEAVEAVTRGETITGNQAAAIARDPVAVEVLEQRTGVKLDTDKPISQVKRDIAGLASREVTQETQRATPPSPAVKNRAEKRVGGFLENGQKAYQEMSRTAEDASSLYAGFSSVYNAGLNGIEADKAKGRYAAMLTPEQRYTAYNAGLEDARAQVARENAEVASVTTTAGAGLADNEYSRYLIAAKKDTAATLNAWGKKLGVRIEIVDQVMGGKANGQYIKEQNLIQIAADSGKPLLNVTAHEITHRMQGLSPSEYRKFRQAAVEYKMQENGADTEAEIVERYMEAAEKESVTLTRDEVKDELAADFAGDMLDDAALFAKFSKENRTAAQKLLDSLKEFLNKVRGLFTGKYRDMAAQEAYGKDFAELEDIAKQWQTAFDAAAQQAEKAKPAAGEGDGKYADTNAARSVGVSVDANTKSASPAQYSLKTWSESDYVTQREKAAEELSAALNISVRTATKYIDSINSVAKMIANDRVRLDYKASPGRSGFVGNSEYGGSLDFSTICKKRRLLTGTMEAIQNALPNTALTAEEILTIRKMMADKGYEVSCGLCYVEGSRANMGKYTQEFLTQYAETNPPYLPNMAEMNTATGQEKLRISHPEVYEAYEKYMNKLAQRKPKLYQLATEYQGEIRSKFKGKGSVEAKNRNGGMRLQSFSDFEIIHLIDCMQAIMDMSEVGLAGQAYTKVPDFAWALGNTGLKINLSLIAKGVDANGNLILDETEGMHRADAEKLRNAYSKNVGTILVVFNDEQLNAAMRDNFIDFIIPFHRSQWNSTQYGLLGLPEGAKDYTPWQNESYIDPVYNKNGKKQRPANYMPNEYWDFRKSGKENAEVYLQMCAQNNRKPKFSYLLDKAADGSYALKKDGSTDGYWKLLIDFKMYDNNGRGVPQQPVKPTFNMAECERMLNEYQGGHQTFPAANDVVAQFVQEYKETHPNSKFSLKATEDVEREARELRKERNALAKQNEALKQRVQELKGEMRISKEPSVVLRDVKKLGQETIRRYGSDVKYTDIQADMEALGSALMKKDVSMDDLMPYAKNAATAIVDNTTELTEHGAELLEIRDYLKRQKILFNGDMANYGDFRKSHMGTLKLNKSNGTPVDIVYDELAEMFGEGYFPGDVYTEADMLLQIGDVLDSMDTIYENPFDSYRDAAIQEIANDIIDGMISDQVRQKKTYADRRALEKQEAVGRVREMLTKEREKRRDMVKRMRREYSEKTQKGREKRYATEMRAKIARHTGPISEKLLRPTDKKHIPEELRVVVAALLRNINLESAYSYDENGRIQKNGGGDPTQRTLAAEKLKKAYEDIIEREGNIVVDPDLLDSGGLLDRLAALGDKRIADMNVTELEAVWNTVRAIETTLTSYDRTLANQKYARTSEWAESLMMGSMSRKRRNRKISLDMADPYTFFSAYGDGGMQVYRTLRNAQDREHVMLMELRNAAKKFLDADVYKNRGERHTFTTGRGVELTLTTDQIMNLYNLARRGEQAMHHLTVGGIVQPEIKRNGKLKAIPRGNDNILLTEADIKAITSVLTPEQIKVANGLQKLASTKLAEWGNEASMQVYGYRKFKEENYWPIKAAKDAVASSVEKDADNARSIKNMGSAKALTPNASNALDIGGAYDVFAQNASDMVKYATLLAPMEDINRLYNYRYRDSMGNLTGKNVRQVLSGVYGDAAQSYWRNLMRDVQNGMVKNASSTTRAVERIVGNTKGAAVGANLRVIIQQPTAYCRAAVVLEPENMTKGLTKGATAGNGWGKARKWAPIAGIKDTSGFDQGSRYTIAREVYGSSDSIMDKLRDWSSRGAANADAITWGKIWNACEWQVAADTNTEVGSDAYYRQVAELFTDVIDQTQVVDGVMQRTQIMRDSDALTRQATAFMGEPLKSLNVLMRSYDAWVYETNPQKRSNALKQLKRSVGALLVTDVVNALAQSIVDGLRDDDKDKNWAERILEAFTGYSGDEGDAGEAVKNVVLGGNLISNINPVGRIPYLKDILSILQGYTVDRMDAAAADDIIRTSKTFIKGLGGDSKTTTAYNLKQVMLMCSKVFGISVGNMGRDMWSIARSIANDTGNVRVMFEMEKAIYRMDKSAGNRKRWCELLYRAQKDRDTETARMIYKEMLEHGYEESDVRQGVEAIMKNEQGVESVKELKNRWRAP